MAAETLNLVMIGVAFGLLMAGFPVAFTLASVAIGFAALGHLIGVFPIGYLSFIGQRMYGIMSNDVLLAVPLFVFMGLMLERSRVAEELLTSMAALVGGRAGGLGISVIVVGALLAASTGIVGATVVTMGLLAMPVMLKHGYDTRLASGTICAAGTLGQIIPPSIVLVFLGDFLSHANQQANMESGNVTGGTVSVGDLFAGALLPGLLIVCLYLLYLAAAAWAWPKACPPIVGAGSMKQGGSALREIGKVLFAPVALMVAVLGSILFGVATPTEAAGVGAVGAVVLGASRAAPRYNWLFLSGVASVVLFVALRFGFDLRIQRLSISGSDWAAILAAVTATAIIAIATLVAFQITFRHALLHDVVQRTARITAMVFTVLIGASLFTLVFRGFGGEETVQGFFEALPGGLFGAMLFVMAVIFLLGFFLDFMEIIFIVIPIVAPLLILMGADPIWLGVMIAVNLQTSFLTPPFGFALFYLRSVAPVQVETTAIYRGVVPFIVLQLIAMALVAIFPGLATFLPNLLY